MNVLDLARHGKPAILTHCHRCNRRYRGEGDWNVEFKAGVAQWLLCPACQTPEENLEAQANEAVLDYSTTTVDSHGRAFVKPRMPS